MTGHIFSNNDSLVVTEGGAPVCTIHIGRGAAERVSELLPDRDISARIALLSQPPARPVAESIAADLTGAGHRTTTYELPDREAAKTLAVAHEVALFLNESGLTRDDLVIGVGGGAATDLAGFVAAVYLRGVECVLVPTTLLAAVDAAIGGKSAVNVGGKNLIGAFKHPSAVIIDTALLAGLPLERVREGAAEAVKAGFIGDPALVDLYERDGLDADIDEVVRRSVAVKVRVVSADFTESGIRATLNYGHTIGHAVEVVTGWPHGDAVGVGMIAASAVSEAVAGFVDRERHDAVIGALGLPTRLPDVDPTALHRQIALDKKRDRDGLRMVLLEEIGSATVAHVDAATVTAALAAIGAA